MISEINCETCSGDKGLQILTIGIKTYILLFHNGGDVDHITGAPCRKELPANLRSLLGNVKKMNKRGKQ